MSEVKKICITLAEPKPPSFHGKIAEGHYKVEDGTVLLTDKAGYAVDRYRLTRKLKVCEDAQGVACALLRQRYSASSGGSFNRTLVYPKLVY